MNRWAPAFFSAQQAPRSAPAAALGAIAARARDLPDERHRRLRQLPHAADAARASRARQGACRRHAVPRGGSGSPTRPTSRRTRRPESGNGPISRSSPARHSRRQAPGRHHHRAAERVPIPLLIFLRDMADEDVQATVAYIRAVPACGGEQGRRKSEYTILRPFFFLPPAYGPAVTAAAHGAPKSDKVAYGAYLAGPPRATASNAIPRPAGRQRRARGLRQPYTRRRR